MKIFLLLWLGLLPLLGWGADAGLPAGKNGAEPTAPQLYRRGRVSFQAGKYPEAIFNFTNLIDGFPADPLVPAAKKYLARAVKAQKKADAYAAAPAPGAPGENNKPVLRPIRPAEKPAAEEQQAVPAKGDPANCKAHRASDKLRVCNWYDAQAYCEGRLPTVIQLQELNLAECPAGKHDGICGCRIWSSEENGPRAKTVITGNGGEINSDKKKMSNIFVLCAGTYGN